MNGFASMPSVCFLQPSPPVVGSKEEPQLGQINIKPAFTSPTNLAQCADFLRNQVCCKLHPIDRTFDSAACVNDTLGRVGAFDATYRCLMWCRSLPPRLDLPPSSCGRGPSSILAYGRKSPRNSEMLPAATYSATAPALARPTNTANVQSVV